ncbi:MAG: Spx/MgsR family RNA polymerase-binding regulatory protein [Erysipelotrichaceae bacterium]|nr:Spx/MgsR family RNA polymerase-binding regulatory protein [Erysipelotrichaceae bacterium]MDD3808996.1 Spx/MgsR family RNA polymerase-binding regulatory protein [Erysipelotrichaceae bacterium]
MIYLYGYKKCSTCQKAIRMLNQLELEYSFHDFIETNLDISTIERIHKKSKTGLDKLFNTRGKKFQELKLKERLLEMSDSNKIELLSGDGYLIKRPILESEDIVIIGYDEELYKQLGE